MTRYIVLVVLALLVLPGCAQKVIRVGPNYQAEIEADADFAAAVVPLLDEKVAATKGTEECPEWASLLIYGKLWSPHLLQLRLAAAGLGEAPESDPEAPTPDALCKED